MSKGRSVTFDEKFHYLFGDEGVSGSLIRDIDRL